MGDSPDILEIAKATLEVAENSDEINSGFRDFELFSWLFQETQRRANSGIPQKDWAFANSEIGRALGIEGPANKQRKAINTALSNFEEKQPAIQTRLIEFGYSEAAIIKKRKDGKKNFLYLDICNIQAQQSSLSEESTPQLVIYEPTKRKILRQFDSFELDSTKKNLVFTILGILTLLPILSIALRFTGLISNSLFVTFIALTWLLMCLWMPFHRTLSNGASIAPFWLSPSLFKNPLLVLEKTEQGYLQFAIRSYKAICPVCGAKMGVEQGKSVMKGRLVGQCQLTNEHQYTFDHVKERGVPANTPMYLPKG